MTTNPDTSDSQKRRRELPDGFWRNTVLAVPLVLMTTVAVLGQIGWLQDAFADKHAPWFMPYLFAAALESVGLFLISEAHHALLAGDAALRLRMGSYAVAGVAGAMNYAHWSGPDLQPTALAVALAGMSALSPVLWSIRSRSMHRAALRDLGLIDPRSVRFAAARWVLYPVRTWRVMRSAVWAGEVNPEAAVAAFDPASATQSTPDSNFQPEKLESGADIPTFVADQPPKAAPRSVGVSPAWIRAAAREITAGNPPSIRTLKARHKIGEPKAREILAAAQESVDQATVVAFGGAR